MTHNTESGTTAAPPTSGSIDTPDLQLSWTEAPWDTVIFGNPVLQINRIEVRGPGAKDDIGEFVRARDAVGSKLVSCRMPHATLRESMLLEDIGFRFIEMLYQPEFDDLQSRCTGDKQGLTITRATEADLPEVIDASGTAFSNERIHIDPRLSSRLGDLRYQNWVRSSLAHTSQRLHALRDGQTLVAFFVTEALPDGSCYWHLNAVAPGAQGQGYGRRAWQAMMAQARDEGAVRVRTAIVARNHRVLNLYARLGFRFPAPLMTFHWVHPE